MTSSCSALPFSGSYRADLVIVLFCLLSLLRLYLLSSRRAGLTSLRPRALYSIRNLGSTTTSNPSGFANIPDPHRDGSEEGCFAGTLARRHDLTDVSSRGGNTK